MSACASCGQPVVWCNLLTLDGGRPHPLDAEPLAGAAVGCVAFKPVSGNALVLTAERMQRRLSEMLEEGVVFHRSHFETCAMAERHRGVSRDQTSFDV